MRKRLIGLDIKKLEQQYFSMINKGNIEYAEKTYSLPPVKQGDKLSFLLNPHNLIEYDDNLINTQPRPGIDGLYQNSLRWIGQ